MRAAVYLRLSLDRSGDELGVTRQREDAHLLAASRDWTITRTFEDNDTSAAGKVQRPGFLALLTAIKDGELDAVITWSLDRLVRTARDRLALMEACKESGTVIALVRGSDIDPTTPAGRLTMGILGEVASHEIDAKSDRQTRAARQAAELGKPPAGRVAFGWAANRIDHHPEQADAIRKAYAAIMAGSSLSAIARRWNEQGLLSGRKRVGKVAPGTPSQWQPETVKVLLLNPRNAGLRAYRGEIIGQTQAKPIVPVETWHAVREILTDPKRDHAPPAARHLLSGIATCSVCGHPVFAGTRRFGYGTYRCGSNGHVARRGDHVDALIAGGTIEDVTTRGLVVERLSRPDAIDLLPQENVADLAQLKKHAKDVQARIDKAAVEFADDPDVTPQQLRVITARLRHQLAEVETELAAAGRTSILAPLATAEDVEHVWRAMDIDQQRAVIYELMNITLHPTGRGARRFDPTTIEIKWKTETA